MAALMAFLSMCFMLMATAATMVHMAHGWYYIAPETAEASVRLTKFMEWLQHYLLKVPLR